MTCPECDSLISISGRNHCPTTKCRWVRCSCGAVVDLKSGRFIATTLREKP